MENFAVMTSAPLKKYAMPKLVFMLLLLLSPIISHASWWNQDWKKRDKVELNTSATGVEIKEAQTSVPVVVRLHTGNFAFTDAKPDGSDLRFVAADDKTLLKYFVERFDAANELAVVWVQLPTLAPGNATQSVWLYHGNPNAPEASDSKSVYDAGSVVFNFSEADGIAKDGSSNGITPSAKPAGIEQAGLLGASAVFNGEAMVLPDTAALKHAAGSNLSISMWLKPQAATAKAALYQQGNIELTVDTGALMLRVGGATVAKGGQIKPDTWQHVALVFGNGRAAIYLDGAEVVGAQNALPELSGDVRIGEGLLGSIDSLQISSAMRSADWVKLAARSQGADNAFPQVVAEDEAEGDGQPNYFGILVGNLTTDAWAVIGILAVMLVIAVWVMITKAQLVSRTDGANRQFLKRFRDAHDDFINLQNESSFAHSSLYRLFEAGSRELRKRFDPNVASHATVSLSGASIDAIKASIDADLVRESHRLNAQMVLLTIAISGGPFLGLLGTVAGVMITFAGIAAAGDVNVNAIAPGIASALLATVAGLAVAIPALFGYNYLATRIKNISADMQIFVDEFVTRIAEIHGAR
jgi:biopolymer transport protein ExbB